jgi:hypothetical protein
MTLRKPGFIMAESGIPQQIVLEVSCAQLEKNSVKWF